MTRKFTAETKEGSTGHPSIIVQPFIENGLPDDKRIRIDFAKGTSLDEAQELARKLNKSVFNICIVDR